MNIEDITNDLIELHHPLEAVTKVLAELEAVEYRWTLQQVLEADESWMEDIITMRSLGERWLQLRQRDEK